MNINNENQDNMTQNSEKISHSEEVQALKNEVEVLSIRLKESEKFKSHFLSNIRNALVNPFSSVIGLSGEIIKSDLHDWKRVIKMAALIHSEAFDLDFQLSNIFCTAELESGERHPDICETEIKDIVDDCIQSFHYLVRKKNIEIFTAAKYERKTFYTDPGFISLVLRNLIHNAIKYSQKPGRITVEVHLDDQLQISVVDEGIGIDDQHLTFVFERFSRGDKTINSIDSGHGLGLPIVKNLMDMLGGDIEVHSTPGKGSKFTVIIPESPGTNFYPKSSIEETSSNAFIF